MDEDLTSSLTILSPIELPAITDEQLLADALIRLSTSSLGNERLAAIGYAAMNYCLTLAVSRALDTDWNNSESAAIKQQLLSHKFTSRLAITCGLREAAGLTDGKFDDDAETLGQSFEAYIGALHEDGNPSTVHASLNEIFIPYVLPTLELLRAKASAQSTRVLPTNGPSLSIPKPQIFGNSTRYSPNTPTPPTAAPEGALQQLNQSLDRAKLLHKLSWDEQNAAETVSSAPQWRYVAHFQCKNGSRVVVGQATDSRKKVAKNAAAHDAYLMLRKMHELSG